MAALRLGLLSGLLLAQTAFEKDPFQPLEDYAPPPPPSRTVLGLPSPTYWQQRADYQMQITLDPTTHRLRGEAEITYHNASPLPLCQLWLALEPNYFSLKSLAHQSRNFQWEDFRRDAKRKEAGFAELYTRQIENYLKTNFRLEAIALRVGLEQRTLPYRIEETLMEITLPTCLASGEKVTLYVRWSFTVNDGLVEGRGGYMKHKDGFIYQIAQYYPRPVAFTDVRGWEKMPYYGSSEFATEFGDYTVTIRMPKGYVVAATGELQNPEAVLSPKQLARYQAVSTQQSTFLISASEVPQKVTPDTITWRYVAQNVRDFAFAASPLYVWEARLASIPGRPRPVRVQAFYPKDMAPIWQHLAIAAAEHTLRSYSQYTFPFPYPAMNVTYGAIYGMEYPMIVFCGRQELKNNTYTESARHGFISLVIHEVGHNFFPMIVNSDERRWMWLDEGLNTYLENLTKATFEPMIREREMVAERNRVRQYLASPNGQAILIHPHTIREIGANAYLKVAIGLETLREYILDPQRMDTAFRRYAEAWAFRHPEPWDFFRVISNSVGQELGWFWKGWFLDHQPIDIAIDTVIQRPLELDPKTAQTLAEESYLAAAEYVAYLKAKAQPHSFFVDERPELQDKIVQRNREEYATYIARFAEEATAAEAALTAYQKQAPDKRLYETRVTFSNKGGLVWPIWVRLTLEGGTHLLWRFPAESWMKDPKKLVKVFYTTLPVTQVQVDPWGLSLDIAPLNHAYTVTRGAP